MYTTHSSPSAEVRAVPMNAQQTRPAMNIYLATAQLYQDAHLAKQNDTPYTSDRPPRDIGFFIKVCMKRSSAVEAGQSTTGGCRGKDPWSTPPPWLPDTSI